jgi:NADPH2:quinone reductase
MRALVCHAYGPPESLVIEQRDDPEPAANQLVIDVAAAGINFPDVLVIAGKYQVKTEPPFIPGNEAAGIVSAIGDGVKGFAIGDRVVGTTQGGAFAEKCVVDAAKCLPIPHGLDFEQAAGFTVTYGTSYHALKQSTKLQAGEALLVLGAAGGVGIAAVEIGKAIGARVIASASSDEKLEFAREAGADETINYSKVSLRDTVKTLTGDKGVDVVYDPVGGEFAEPALRCVGWRGRYLVVGFAAGDIPRIPVNLLLLKGSALVGVFWGEFVKREPRLNATNMKTLFGWLGEGRIRPLISRRYPLSGAADALDALLGRQAVGKLVVLPQQTD